MGAAIQGRQSLLLCSLPSLPSSPLHPHEHQVFIRNRVAARGERHCPRNPVDLVRAMAPLNSDACRLLRTLLAPLSIPPSEPGATARTVKDRPAQAATAAVVVVAVAVPAGAVAARYEIELGDYPYDQNLSSTTTTATTTATTSAEESPSTPSIRSPQSEFQEPCNRSTSPTFSIDTHLSCASSSAVDYSDAKELTRSSKLASGGGPARTTHKRAQSETLWRQYWD